MNENRITRATPLVAFSAAGFVSSAWLVSCISCISRIEEWRWRWRWRCCMAPGVRLQWEQQQNPSAIVFSPKVSLGSCKIYTRIPKFIKSRKKVVKSRIPRLRGSDFGERKPEAQKGGNAASLPADVMASATTQKLNNHP